MSQSTGQILKKDSIKISGSCRLGSGHAAALRQPVPQARQTGVQSAAGQERAQAQIVETTPTGVVIEVICPCGAHTYVECEFAK